MERHGFSGYWREWWHFEHRVQGDRPARPHPGVSAARTRDNRVMSELLRVALAQIDPKVGDITGNARKIAEYTARARERGASLVVFPELALTGYPPEDLLLKTGFLDAAAAALEELASQTNGHRRRWSASRSGPTTCTTPPRCSPTAGSRPCTARCTSPTTACSTSSATSSRAPRR